MRHKAQIVAYEEYDQQGPPLAIKGPIGLQNEGIFLL